MDEKTQLIEQANEAKLSAEILEDALLKIYSIPNYTDGYDWAEIEEARQIVAEVVEPAKLRKIDESRELYQAPPDD